MQSSHEIVPVADFLNSLGGCKIFPRIFLNFVANHQIPEILTMGLVKNKSELCWGAGKSNRYTEIAACARKLSRLCTVIAVMHGSTNNATTLCVWLYLSGVGSITIWHRAYLFMSF